MAVGTNCTWRVSAFPGVSVWVLIRSSQVQQQYQMGMNIKISTVLRFFRLENGIQETGEENCSSALHTP